MDLLLHPAHDQGRGRPDRGGRLGTVGHRQAFRAFARAAKQAGIRFMVSGGTCRDSAVRTGSTRDIDIVLIDRKDLDPALMAGAGFTPAPRSAHVWRYDAEGRTVDLEIAAVASSTEPEGPFSVAFQHADTRVVEGIEVTVPRIEDFVILKLLAAVADRRRHARDLADVQSALETFAGRAGSRLSVPAVRARLRDLYGLQGQRLKDVIGMFREVARSARG